MLTVKVLGGSAHLLKRKNLFALLGVNTTLYYVRYFLLLTLYVRLYYVGSYCPPISPFGEDGLIEDSFSRALELRRAIQLSGQPARSDFTMSGAAQLQGHKSTVGSHLNNKPPLLDR